MDNTILYTPTLYTKVEGEFVLKTVQEKPRQKRKLLAFTDLGNFGLSILYQSTTITIFVILKIDNGVLVSN